MELRCDEQVAVVTGGSRGIGAAVSQALARAGARVVINHLPDERDTEGFGAVLAQIEAGGGSCLSVPGDVTDAAFCGRLCRTAVDEFGRLDILVNNAGISGDSKRIADMSPDNWDKVINTDLRGSFLFCRAAAKPMIAQKSGKIINISSASSFKAVSGLGAYATAKAGMIMLTKTLAVELGRFNIQVNAMSPGYILTDFNRELFESDAGKKLIETYSGLKRLGTPKELKGPIVYLASDAGSFTTGTSLVVDGGQWL